jgi:hypothetical protein
MSAVEQVTTTNTVCGEPQTKTVDAKTKTGAEAGAEVEAEPEAKTKVETDDVKVCTAVHMELDVSHVQSRLLMAAAVLGISLSVSKSKGCCPAPREGQPRSVKWYAMLVRPRAWTQVRVTLWLHPPEWAELYHLPKPDSLEVVGATYGLDRICVFRMREVLQAAIYEPSDAAARAMLERVAANPDWCSQWMSALTDAEDRADFGKFVLTAAASSVTPDTLWEFHKSLLEQTSMDARIQGYSGFIASCSTPIRKSTLPKHIRKACIEQAHREYGADGILDASQQTKTVALEVRQWVCRTMALYTMMALGPKHCRKFCDGFRTHLHFLEPTIANRKILVARHQFFVALEEASAM